MDTKPLVLTPDARSAALNVVGTQVTVLVADAQAKNQQITLQTGDEGSGPPPHSHDWAESFYVTKGTVQFTCGDTTTLCHAGTFVHIPGGTIHAFSYGPGGGEMLEVTGAGSRAIPMFTAMDREIPPGPPDVDAVIRVTGAYGLTFHL